MRKCSPNAAARADSSPSEDALMTASNNVTEALQRTMALMQGELEKSVLSTQLLGMSFSISFVDQATDVDQPKLTPSGKP